MANHLTAGDPAGRPAKRGTRRALKVLGALGVCAALGVAPALAAWSTTGTGIAQPVARSLTTPAAPTVETASATASSLVVNGTLPGGQAAGTAYTLKRGATSVCTRSASPWTCTDTGLAAATTYSYTLVASLGAWTATSAAGTGSTTCATADSFDLVAPASVIAGTAFNVQVTRKNCDGSTDAAYSGAQSLSFAGLATSPSGKAPTYGPNNFIAGTATVSVSAFKAGPQTLTISQAGTSGSTSLTAVAGAVGAIGLNNAVSGGTAVTVTCDTVDASRTCSQTGNGGNANNNWSATVTLLDSWGNTAVNTSGSAVPVTFTAALGMSTPSGVTIANGASSANFTINMGGWTWIFGSDVTIKVAYNGNKQIAITLS